MNDDTKRIEALEKWLDSVDFETGLLSFAVPGILTGKTRVGVDIRAVIDRALDVEAARV